MDKTLQTCIDISCEMLRIETSPPVKPIDRSAEDLIQEVARYKKEDREARKKREAVAAEKKEINSILKQYSLEPDAEQLLYRVINWRVGFRFLEESVRTGTVPEKIERLIMVPKIPTTV